jgi:hypothetical protein
MNSRMFFMGQGDSDTYRTSELIPVYRIENILARENLRTTGKPFEMAPKGFGNSPSPCSHEENGEFDRIAPERDTTKPSVNLAEPSFNRGTESDFPRKNALPRVARINGPHSEFDKRAPPGLHASDSPVDFFWC